MGNRPTTNDEVRTFQDIVHQLAQHTPAERSRIMTALNTIRAWHLFLWVAPPETDSKDNDDE